ncbi:MAG TPA: IS110 family transposase [Candidatus Binatia bacterium]|nr:IS110 family transposase [Candidatus Binatia bacterium]
MSYFAGLDWAAREHAICVVDGRGAVVAQFTVAHSTAGMTELVARLAKVAPPSELRVAIERPTGLLVDTLVEQGFIVVAIHPNAVKASRPRYSAAEGKTDDGDAYLLADLLRTDGHRFRELTPLSDETKALRGLVRVREDLVGQRVKLANQLRCLLEQFWPGAAEIFADVESPIALEFLDRYPTPQSASSLGEKRMAAFMARHAYCGRRSAGELLERLRGAPPAVAGELEAEAKGECVRALVAVLRPLVAQIATLTAAVEHAVEAHPDAMVVTPLFKIGRVCAAQLLAELGDDRGRFVSADHLAAEAGVAPVTRESGKHRAVSFRWACNMRLRSALATLADTTRHTSPWARALYKRARDRGCEHAHAIRILARAWCRVLWHCWQKRVAYDPAKHRAARAFTLRAVEQEAA